MVWYTITLEKSSNIRNKINVRHGTKDKDI